MKDEKIICPKCKSDNTILLNSNRKVFTAGGAGVGGVLGFFARQVSSKAGMTLGATIGSAVPIVGTVAGATIGGIAGAVAGMATGAAVGNIVGGKIDEMVATYRCKKCGDIFEL
jgi:DNA-directed RNA polymerase subunit RPC12/RpoP